VNVVIFLGPSLSAADARAELEATYLPPAAQGDVYRAARERPFAIGIVDGYFEHVPSVWHKEVLWALAQGIHVFGAASMGALRAAELARFGMHGVGAVYEAFRSGALEDDDEVAVTHADAAGGYRPLSDAMVNIRGTLRAAVAAGAIDQPLAGRLEARAKAFFYPDRAFVRLLAQALEAGEPPARIEALRAFVASSYVDVKRNDALALLRAIRGCVEARLPPAAAQFSFARTEAWDQVVEWAETQPPLAAGEDHVDVELLAAEACVAGPGGRALLAASLARAAAAALAVSAPAPTMAQLRAARDQEWRRAALGDEARGQIGSEVEPAFAEWLTRNGLTASTYPGFVDRDAQSEWLKDRFGADVNRFVADELRAAGDYEALCRRARDKQVALAAHGLAEPTLEDTSMDRAELLAWYFEQRMGGKVPEDLARYCRDNCIAGLPALERRAARELLFQRLRGPAQHQ
jgi:hypothetical protein